ncbi:MAG: ribonuclease P protein component [Bacilli bacterium]
MKKKYIIKKSYDFKNLIKNGNKYSNSFFSFFINENKLGYSRFGISIPKKIGIAVKRNKIKRIIKNIISNNIKFFNNIDCVIIVNSNILEMDYYKIKKELIFFFKKIKKQGVFNNEK